MKSFGPTDYICINHFSNDQYYDPKSSSKSVRLFSTAIPHPVTIMVSFSYICICIYVINYVIILNSIKIYFYIDLCTKY